MAHNNITFKWKFTFQKSKYFFITIQIRTDPLLPICGREVTLVKAVTINNSPRGPIPIFSISGPAYLASRAWNEGYQKVPEEKA